MKLTREDWQKLEKMSIKDRLERLEERAYDISERLSDMDLKEFNKEMENISEDADKHTLWVFGITMVLT
jgi:septation ring formation regulator EzrA